MKKRFTEEQIILPQAEADGVVIRDLCRKHNITEQTFPGGGTSTTGWCLSSTLSIYAA
jgi:putative transposase